jgi:hypothetical protein
MFFPLIFKFKKNLFMKFLLLFLVLDYFLLLFIIFFYSSFLFFIFINFFIEHAYFMIQMWVLQNHSNNTNVCFVTLMQVFHIELQFFEVLLMQ